MYNGRAHDVTLGYGELYVNGERAGDDRLDPAWTVYDKRVLYSTYEIENLLSEGQNALGMWLGRGWFSKGFADIFGAKAPSGPPRALVQVNVTYADGTSESIATDTSWRASGSPITRNDVFDGETYDARLEQPGWAAPGYDDSDWEAAVELQELMSHDGMLRFRLGAVCPYDEMWERFDYDVTWIPGRDRGSGVLGGRPRDGRAGADPRPHQPAGPGA